MQNQEKDALATLRENLANATTEREKEYWQWVISKAPDKPNLPAVIPTGNLPVLHNNTSFDALLNAYEYKNMEAVVEFRSGLSVPAILERKCSQISLFKRESPAQLDRMLKQMLLQFAKGFSIDKGLGSDDIYEIVAEIKTNYWHLSIEDITLFLDQIKKGKFGDVLLLNVFRVLGWLAKYDAERMALIERNRNTNPEYSDTNVPRLLPQKNEATKVANILAAKNYRDQTTQKK